MSRLLLKNALIVTGTTSFNGCLGIEGERISGIWKKEPEGFEASGAIDLGGKILMAGGIDAHVHFRDPGLTWKADIGSESESALLGGITSFIDMPNTKPPTISIEALEEKSMTASLKSRANYGFHLGATNTNVSLIKEYLDAGMAGRFAGIKVFMGSSTGNMLVDNDKSLNELFKIGKKPILVHCEDEGIIRANMEASAKTFGDSIPFSMHPRIRSREACIKSTGKAIRMALEYGTALHILHVSTKEEIEMIREAKVHNPKITAETSPNYLWFCDKDYDRLQGKVKCNPSIKSGPDRDALRQALAEGVIDTIGSDHAPHLLAEKDEPYLKCPSGIPSVRESLPVLLTVARDCGIPLERLAEVLSENPARIFGIKDRGFLKEGFFADLVVIDPDGITVPAGSGYKCGWTPYEGIALKGSVDMVWINGELAVSASKPSAATGRCRPRPLLFQSIG